MPRLFKTTEALIILVGIWVALFCNAGFWHVIAANKPVGMAAEMLFFGSLIFLTVGLISLVFLLLTFGRATRVVLGLALLAAASAGYFTANYGVLVRPWHANEYFSDGSCRSIRVTLIVATDIYRRVRDTSGTRNMALPASATTVSARLDAQRYRPAACAGSDHRATNVKPEGNIFGRQK